jgi:SAM-dependent methyltransferase
MTKNVARSNRLSGALAYLKSLPHQRIFLSQKPCACCGARLRRHFRIIWDDLSNEWNLSHDFRRMMDRREGTICAFCKTPSRTRHLAAALLDELATTKDLRFDTMREFAKTAPADLRIAEINQVPGVHKFLIQLPGTIYSEFGGANSEDLMALTYVDETFDYVLTSDTLEHVPDFDRALSEIHRVLRPGGAHIFTIPVIWERSTRQRASLANGQVIHHLPPSYHGTPKTTGGDLLVFNEFGGDVVPRIEGAGFQVTLYRSATNSAVITILARKLAKPARVTARAT